MSTLKHAVPRFGFCCQFILTPEARQAMLSGTLHKLDGFSAIAGSTNSMKPNQRRRHNKKTTESKGRVAERTNDTNSKNTCVGLSSLPSEWQLLPREVVEDFEKGKRMWKPSEIEAVERSFTTRSTTFTNIMTTLGPTSSSSDRVARAVARDKLLGIIQHNLTANLKLIEYVGTQFPLSMRMVRLSGGTLPLFTVPRLGGWFFNNDSVDATSPRKGKLGGVNAHGSVKEGAKIMSDPALDALVCEGFKKLGDAARAYDVRLSFHPCPSFVALASDKPHVVENALAEMNYHAKMIEAMGYGRHFQDLKCNVHIAGKLGPDAIRHAVFPRLSETLKNTITFENDERTYGLDDVLLLSDLAPVVIDVHHCWVHEGDYFKPESLFKAHSPLSSEGKGKERGRATISARSNRDKLKQKKDEERLLKIIDSWSPKRSGGASSSSSSSAVRPVMHYSQPCKELFIGKDAPLAHLQLGPDDALVMENIVGDSSESGGGGRKAPPSSKNSPKLLNKRDLFRHSDTMWNDATNRYVLGKLHPGTEGGEAGRMPSASGPRGFADVFDIMFEAKHKSAAVVDFYRKHIEKSS